MNSPRGELPRVVSLGTFHPCESPGSGDDLLRPDGVEAPEGQGLACSSRFMKAELAGQPLLNSHDARIASGA